MRKAIDVANFFIDIANANGNEDMTNLRTNKLAYLAQCWSLALRNKPLFDEDFQAWKLGPVLPSVYRAFHAFGKNPIEKVCGDYDCDDFDEDELDLLMAVFSEYQKYSTTWLVSKTHEDNAPWQEVYVEGQNNTISKDAMKKYFSLQKPLNVITLPEKSEYIGYTDPKTGLLVLPTEWDDGYDV